MVFGSSPLTTADLIRQAQYHVRGSSRPQLNALADNFTPMQDEMVMSFPVAGVQIGQSIEVGLTSYVVTEVNTATQTLGVVAQVEPGTHAAGDRVVMRPTYDKHRIITEMNNELSDLSTRGLYRVETIEPGSNDVVTPPDGALEILDIWSDEPRLFLANSRQLPEGLWKLVDGPSGLELRGPRTTAELSFVVFGCTFNPLSLTDDTVNVVDTTGLWAEALDILAFGAAMRLMFGTESQRNIVSHQGDTRRSAEVPPGANIDAMRTLASQHQTRIVAEQQRLRQRYGYSKWVGP